MSHRIQFSFSILFKVWFELLVQAGHVSSSECTGAVSGISAGAGVFDRVDNGEGSGDLGTAATAIFFVARRPLAILFGVFGLAS